MALMRWQFLGMAGLFLSFIQHCSPFRDVFHINFRSFVNLNFFCIALCGRITLLNPNRIPKFIRLRHSTCLWMITNIPTLDPPLFVLQFELLAITMHFSQTPFLLSFPLFSLLDISPLSILSVSQSIPTIITHQLTSILLLLEKLHPCLNSFPWIMSFIYKRPFQQEAARLLCMGGRSF